MKKVLSLILVTILLFTVTGCSPSEEKIYEQYQAMQESLVGVEALDIDILVKANATDGEEVIDMDMTGKMQQLIRSENDMDLSMEMKVSVPGEDPQELKMYFVDGMAYQEMMGMKIAISMSLDEMAGSLTDSTMPSIEFEAITNAKSEKVDGGTKISMDIDGTLMQDALTEPLNNLLGAVDLDGIEVTFGSVQYTAIIGEDNLPKNQNLIYTVVMTHEDETVDINYDMNLDYVGINNFDSIDFPSDLSEYQIVG